MEFESAESSGRKTVDSVICDRPCVLTGVQVINDGTNQATLVVYDNATEAVGKIVFQGSTVTTAANAAGLTYISKDWVFPVECREGLYADITGTGASYIVEYIQL